MIRVVDEGIGRMLAALDEIGARDTAETMAKSDG